MTGSEMYWLVKLDDIIFFFGSVGGTSLAIGLIFAIAGGVMVDNKTIRLRVYLGVLIPLTLICLTSFTLNSFIPSTKQMAAIMVVPPLINKVGGNDRIKAMPSKIITLADDWIKELSPKK